MKKSDTYWMEQCLRISLRGAGTVSPNPLVGAILVKNGRKIAEGYHERFGGPHAEINAFSQALFKGKGISGSTLYVNLEPCSHIGKTPPCADEIIRRHVSRVVIATADPNPLVSGRGIKKLSSHGISVNVGILEKKARRINEKFIKYITTGIPFFAMKVAQTADGFIAREDGSSQWITNTLSRRYVHQLRHEYDGVLVGANTVLQDDPELTVRSVIGRNPVRIILDGRFTVSVDRKIFNDKNRTFLYVSEEAYHRERSKRKKLSEANITIIPIRSQSGRLDLKRVALDLGQRNIASVLVEGGSQTYSGFLDDRLIDKMYVFTAQKKFRSGIKTFGKLSVSLRKKRISERYFRSDRLLEYQISYR